MDQLRKIIQTKDVNLILSTLQNTPNLNESDFYGNNILHYAAYYDVDEIIQPLYDLGLDCTVKNKFGCGTIHFATANNNIKLVRFFHEKGAVINPSNPKQKEWAPIHFARTLSMVTLLVDELGSDVDIKSPNRSHLPRQVSYLNGHLEVSEFLKDRGAQSISFKDKHKSLMRMCRLWHVYQPVPGLDGIYFCKWDKNRSTFICKYRQTLYPGCQKFGWTDNFTNSLLQLNH